MGRKNSRKAMELTRDQIQAVINQKLDNTIYWLNKAYDIRPQDSGVEGVLLELMASLQKLQREANEALIQKPLGDPSTRRRASQEGAKSAVS